jgi:putative ABC transport system permease protein
MTATVRPAVVIFLAGVACLLLIACANVANLWLSRGISRERELAVRAAIGARRGRVVRQLLTESALTAVLGAAVGVVLAMIGVQLVRVLAPPNFPRLDAVQLDLTAVGFTCAVSLVAGILAGLSPAIRAARLDVLSSLREGAGASPGRRAARFRSILLAGEAAAAIVLVVAAMLLGRSLFQLLSVDPGYEAANVLVALVDLPGAERGAGAFVPELLQRLRALPEVVVAGAGSMAPFGRITAARPLTVPVPGRDPVTARSLVYVVTAGYAEALKLRVRAGRLLNDADRALGTQSLVVNDAFVRTFLAGVEPLGFAIDSILAPGVRAEIVGVVDNVLKDGLDKAPQPEVYVVPAQGALPPRMRAIYDIHDEINLVVRTAGDPASLAPAVRQVVRGLRPDAALEYVTTLTARTSQSVSHKRFAAAMLASFAATAMILSAIGLYSVLAYGVSTREREIGVRTALGANRGTVAWLVVRDGMSVVLAGLLVGLAGAAFATRLMRTLLFGVEPHDPLSFVIAPLVLGAVALMACVLPARRAARVNPLIALRSE